jgi:hypothetical protein
MDSLRKKRVAVVVGSGFSAALTSGAPGILGNRPLPTLNNLTESLLAHMFEMRKDVGQIPFAADIFDQAIGTVRRNAARPVTERYNFEELLSMLSVGSTLSQGSDSPILSKIPGADPSVLACLLYCLSNHLTSSLSYNGLTKSNRNFWYKVNDPDRAIAMKEGIWKLVDENDTSFVSFNYDGLIEAFLDWWMGRVDQQERGYRYLVELSHAIPIAMPEHVYSRPDNRDRSRLARVPVVLKPHGSIHFFQLRRELRGLMTGPTLTAVQPRLDMGFNPATGQRDIPDIQYWEFADPAPLIVPPLLNKSAYFETSYFQAMLRLVVETIQNADYVLVLGFSLPSSDLHVCAAFETVNWKGKRLGLVHGTESTNDTEARWRRAASDATIEVIESNGLPVNSPGSIRDFWQSVENFLK